MSVPSVSDRIFVSIGVSMPGGGLEALPGAIKAAERMAAWAIAQGYETVLIHDRKYPEVTIDLLRDMISAAIERVTKESEIKRFVIFFAGHGAALAVGDQYWILTNWNKRRTEAIGVSSFQRALEFYGPRQVSIIGDACQEFSEEFIDIVGSPVLDIPDEERRRYELDQFFAVDAGKQAFMIKAVDEQGDFCLFTEVLLEALEGGPSSNLLAIEPVDQDWAVTSQSLARYLDDMVAKEAGKYGVRMLPLPRPGFYTDRVYLKMPPPSIDTAPRPHLSTNAGIARLPRMRSVGRVDLISPNIPPHVSESRTDADLYKRKSQRDEFISKVTNAKTRDHFESDCGICVVGENVAKVETSFGAAETLRTSENWYRIRLNDENNSLGWTDTLITLSNGRIYTACAIQDFVTILHILDGRSASLLHRPVGESAHYSFSAISLLAKAHAGLLTQRDIINSASFLRHRKHRIITLGCIAAQFYDVIRDVDSLRSMASFYAQNRQPVPLDIVLYGGGEISESDGRLFAKIPAVRKRVPRTQVENRRGFTFDATPGFIQHPIAGRIPWMRHAWGALATARCEQSAETWRQCALKVMAYLGPGEFTNVTEEGRQALLELAGIKEESKLISRTFLPL